MIRPLPTSNFDRLVTLFEPATSTSLDGQVVRSYAAHATVWARVELSTPKRENDDRRNKLVEDGDLVLRGVEIGSDWRVRIGDNDYDVVAVRDRIPVVEQEVLVERRL